MNDVIGRVFSFEKQVSSRSRELYSRLAMHGPRPTVLITNCAGAGEVSDGDVTRGRDGDAVRRASARDDRALPAYLHSCDQFAATVAA